MQVTRRGDVRVTPPITLADALSAPHCDLPNNPGGGNRRRRVEGNRTGQSCASGSGLHSQSLCAPEVSITTDNGGRDA